MNKKRINAFTIIVATITTALIIILLVFNILSAVKKDSTVYWFVLYSLLVIVSLFTYVLLLVSFWKARYSKTIELINSVNSIDSTQEEVFEVGSLIYDSTETIIYITPWLQREGFDAYLGRKISELGIDFTRTTTHEFSIGTHKWEVTPSRKHRTLLFKEITNIKVLRNIIDSQLKGVISFHTSFSKKVNLNVSVRADATLKINQFIQNWLVKNGGLLNASLTTEGTVSGLFNWRRGEREIYSQQILKAIKEVNSKLNKDITISIGTAYGDEDYSELMDSSLKALDICKNRGGDEIVISNPEGEIEYVGTSKKQAVSGTVLDIKTFYSEFMQDMDKARDIYITSHKMADLDAIGSALGIQYLAQSVNNSVWVVLEQFDQTAQRFYDSLPRRIKETIITEKEAIKRASSMAHYVITDTSNPESTQAENLISEVSPERISIIDHHRATKGKFENIESKSLIETSTSSASEIVVEMLRMNLGADSRMELDPNISTGLLSGIRLDSKQLSKNVTNATFESVAWLMSNDANTTETEALFKPSQDLILIESEAFRNIVKPVDGVIFTYLDPSQQILDEDIALLADKLLSYDGIDATFVLGKTVSGKIKLSTRSNGKINVQHIAENLGGGGHFNVAAAIWPSSTKFETLKTKIIKELGKISNE